MIDSRLTSAGIIAIPLETNVGNTLNPQPNWLVIDNLFNKLDAEIPDLGILPCVNSIYRIVYREILPPVLNRPEILSEIVYEQDNQAVPISISSALYSYQTIFDNLDTINKMLSKFQFRGILEKFTLKVDEKVLAELL